MPENCYLYEYRQVGFLCDGFSVGEPQQPCPVCRNEIMRSVSQAILALAVGFIFLPFFIFYVKKNKKHSDAELKIFDKENS